MHEQGLAECSPDDTLLSVLLGQQAVIEHLVNSRGKRLLKIEAGAQNEVAISSYSVTKLVRAKLERTLFCMGS